MNEKNLKDYLAGEAEDYQSLAEHDKIYHKGGYKEGDACKVREALNKSDDPDRMQQKAEAYGKCTEFRKEAEGVLKKMFGGDILISEGDPREDGSIWFTTQNPQRAVLNARYHEKELSDLGYKASLHADGVSGRQYVNGRIRPYTAQENFERIKDQKPGWSSDGYEVSGKYYDTHGEAMEAWQKEMKKYGGQVKRGVSSSKSEDAAPVKRYLEMC